MMKKHYVIMQAAMILACIFTTVGTPLIVTMQGSANCITYFGYYASCLSTTFANVQDEPDSLFCVEFKQMQTGAGGCLIVADILFLICSILTLLEFKCDKPVRKLVFYWVNFGTACASNLFIITAMVITYLMQNETLCNGVSLRALNFVWGPAQGVIFTGLALGLFGAGAYFFLPLCFPEFDEGIDDEVKHHAEE